LEVVRRGIHASRGRGGGDKLRFLFQWLSQQSTFICLQLMTILLFCKQCRAEMLIKLRVQLRWHAASVFVRVTRGINSVNFDGAFSTCIAAEWNSNQKTTSS